MRKIIVLIVVIGVALAFPQQDVTILRSEYRNSGDGSYDFNYETSDGTKREEHGALENLGLDEPSMNVRGSFEFVAADGKVYQVTYTADANGFRPQGEHIPKYNEGSAAQSGDVPNLRSLLTVARQSLGK